MNRHFARRDLLRILAALAGGAGLWKVSSLLSKSKALPEGALEMTSEDPSSFLPLIRSEKIPTATHTPTATSTPTATATSTPTPTGTGSPPLGPKVVHVHAPGATSWNFSTGWYGNYVDQSVINSMVDEGLKQLTGRPTVVAAWQTLLPDYAPGKAVAIKVNFNNSNHICGDSDNEIDALMEPVNSLIRGMKLLGVREQDIWIYDAVRAIPDRCLDRCSYPGVRFFDEGKCAERATFSSNDPNANVVFSHPHLTTRRITDVIVNATYLINVPIMKDHGIAPVTLGLKNHFGTINEIVRDGDDNLHYYINAGHSLYSSNYNPLVDIYLNPHILNKTVLTVGDGLYGALSNTRYEPARWSTFGDDAPNSLFLAVDPVAIDCVMFDILDGEPGYHPRWGEVDNDYLKLAASAGLGVFERGDPWGMGYERIMYTRMTL